MEAEPLSEITGAVGPGIVKSSAKVGGASAVAGLAFGGIAGTIRSSTPVLFALASSIQCSAIGGIYWATRRSSTIWLARRNAIGAADVSRTDMSKVSAASGAVTGAVVAAIFRGRANVLPAAFVFSGVGYLGQTVANRLDDRAPAADPEAPGLIERALNSRWSPIKRLSDEEYRDILNERLLRTQADIAVIDDELAELREKSTGPESANQDK